MSYYDLDAILTDAEVRIRRLPPVEQLGADHCL